MNNRFSIINVIAGIIITSFVIFMFWPTCSGSYCSAIIWTGNLETDLFSSILFGIIFLIPFFMGLYGIYKYINGYGLSKFGRKESYDINATTDRKKGLLNSSVVSILMSLSIIAVMIWDIVVLLRK